MDKDQLDSIFTYLMFKDLQLSLFNFAGIPHIEVITPDRKRVHESLVMYGFSNFDEEFNDLKSQLE